MTDSNHDIVPTLRMFDGAYMNLAADEIEALRGRLAAVRAEVIRVRRFHFDHNPANTGLAIGFNAVLSVIDNGVAFPSSLLKGDGND